MILKVMLVQARCYARYSAKSRTSKLLVDATNNTHQQELVKQKHKLPVALSQNKISHNQNQESSYPVKNVKKVVHEDGNVGLGLPQFTKSYDLDAQLKRQMLMVKSRKNREKSDRVLLEGKRLIQDAIHGGTMPESIIFSRVEDLKSMSLPSAGIQLFKVPYKTMSVWSDMTTCSGIMGIFKTPNVQEQEPSGCLPLTVVCDNVREPGNLGAILRVAAGAGCHQVILMKGCVDLWEPKVLRAGAGAHFRVPIHKNVSATELSGLISIDSSVFLADNNTQSINAPRGAFHSLVPCTEYHTVDYSAHKSITVVIGGETEGLSDDAMLLAGSRNGARINIPLDNQVESLNTGTALGIILFEIKRQLLLPLAVDSTFKLIETDEIQNVHGRSSMSS